MPDTDQERTALTPEDVQALQRNAQNSLNLARAILGDHEVLRICSAWHGQTATREVRMAMAKALADAVAEKIKLVTARPLPGLGG